MTPNLVLDVVQAYKDNEIPSTSYVFPDRTAGHTNGFRNLAPTWLTIVNDGTVQSVSFSIKAKRPCSQGQLHDLDGTIPPSESREFGPFDHYHYNDEDGYVHFTISGTYDEGDVGVVAVRRI